MEARKALNGYSASHETDENIEQFKEDENQNFVIQYKFGCEACTSEDQEFLTHEAKDSNNDQLAKNNKPFICLCDEIKNTE